MKKRRKRVCKSFRASFAFLFSRFKSAQRCRDYGFFENIQVLHPFNIAVSSHNYMTKS
ncbi:unnamed protein product [Amoebophrya sp. A120]|nr:unnamed protein product [Amoebophrya sp. A120]|eukprot:GSA120T00023446001.1